LAGRREESIVDRKIKLTLIIAGGGTLAAVVSGLAGRMDVFYASLVVIGLSPFISLIIVTRRG